MIYDYPPQDATIRQGDIFVGVPRVDIKDGRLNDVAQAHFRERIAEFFRRYAYDEWYPLDLQTGGIPG